MFQSWRLQVREGEEALQAGRLEEARRLLEHGDLTRFLPGKRLATKLAARLADRARRHASEVDLASAWRDLDEATGIGGETSELEAARLLLIETTVRLIEQRLQHGLPEDVLPLVDELERHAPGANHAETLRHVVKRLMSAENLSRRGRFADADAQLSAAAAVRPDLQLLSDRREQCRARLARHRELTEQLHRSISDSQWSEALSLADELLEIAPESRLARDARRRAWEQVGTKFADTYNGRMTLPWQRSSTHSSEPLPVESGPRFVLWVDGVGGYLVCLADEIVIGQATDGNSVDVPILGDVSRRHAKIRRQGEGYVIEPLHATRVDGRQLQETALLADGATIELGGGVQLRFRQPHALSASARIDLISRHRTLPWADGVLLMAESCVLGPSTQNHVVCRDWTGDVVLYRQDDQLYCRAMESIEIDGAFCDGRGRLEANSRVVGSDFSMSLEELDTCSRQPLL